MAEFIQAGNVGGEGPMNRRIDADGSVHDFGSQIGPNGEVRNVYNEGYEQPEAPKSNYDVVNQYVGEAPQQAASQKEFVPPAADPIIPPTTEQAPPPVQRTYYPDDGKGAVTNEVKGSVKGAVRQERDITGGVSF